MSKANQKAINGTELTPAECTEFQQRNSLCQMKANDANRARMELRMMDESARTYLTSLLMKYELDMTKQYQFDGKGLVKVKQPAETSEEIVEGSLITIL